jgi:hypothetical protein
VVQPSGASHLRVWPYGFAIPTVSYLNYASGQNLANAGIISNAYLQGYDISIYNGSTTHYLADVMGYFYPAPQPVQVLQSGYDLGPSCLVGACNPFGSTAAYFEAYSGSTSVTLDGTQDVLWTFSANVYSDAVQTYHGTVWPAWHNSSIAYPNGISSYNTFECQNDFNFSQWGSSPYINGSHSVQSSCKLTNIPAGTYTFGAQASTGNSYGSSTAAFYFNSAKFTITVIDKP